MEKIVLIGENIAHSRSPHLHNHLFELYGLPYRYELMPISEAEVVPAVESMKRGGYRGANVTSPHKLAVLPALDALSEEAAAIGAVNTIVFAGGKAIGHNTDAHGFITPLLQYRIPARPFSAGILGTGGAAMAAVFALCAIPNMRRLVIYSRDEQRAFAAAQRWEDPRVEGRTYERFTPVDLLVNATPRDLAGANRLPFPPERLSEMRLVYEMIYWPPITPLMQAAREIGIDTIGGGGMFIAQALASFRLWTGMDASEFDVPGSLFEEKAEG